MNVLVYAGRGTSELCVKLTMSSLRKSIGRGYEVKAVDASTLTNDPWETNCALLVIPGGRDLPYVEDLSGLASKRIKRYVSEYGGSYLGICAGAYFGCREIEFDKDGPFEVTGSRPLQFFNGVAYGPIGAFKYDSHEGASAIKLNKAGQIIIHKSHDKLNGNVDIKNYIASWNIIHHDGTPFQEDEGPLARALHYGESCSNEFIIKQEGFEDHIVWANVAPVRSESGEIKGFKNLYSNFKSLKAHAPPGTMSSILRKVKSSDDLALVAKTMEHFPDETVTLFRVGGDDAMNFLRAIDDTQPRQLRMILRKGPLKFQKAKLALRGSKAVANGRLQQGRDLLASWLMAHPDIRRFVLVISSFLLGLGLWLLLRPFLHRNRKQTEEGTRPQQSETASI